jgi:hypothetical protein
MLGYRSTQQQNVGKYLDCINGIHDSVLLRKHAKLVSQIVYLLRKRSILLYRRRRLLPYSAAGRNWVGEIHSCAESSQFYGLKNHLQTRYRVRLTRIPRLALHLAGPCWPQLPMLRRRAWSRGPPGWRLEGVSKQLCFGYSNEQCVPAIESAMVDSRM